MISYSVSYVKTHLLRLLSSFKESAEEIIITKRGTPIARVIPYKEEKGIRNNPGTLADTVILEEDILSPLGEDEWDYSQ